MRGGSLHGETAQLGLHAKPKRAVKRAARFVAQRSDSWKIPSALGGVGQIDDLVQGCHVWPADCVKGYGAQDGFIADAVNDARQIRTEKGMDNRRGGASFRIKRDAKRVARFDLAFRRYALGAVVQKSGEPRAVLIDTPEPSKLHRFQRHAKAVRKTPGRNM